MSLNKIVNPLSRGRTTFLLHLSLSIRSSSHATNRELKSSYYGRLQCRRSCGFFLRTTFSPIISDAELQQGRSNCVHQSPCSLVSISSERKSLCSLLYRCRAFHWIRLRTIPSLLPPAVVKNNINAYTECLPLTDISYLKAS